MAAATPASPDGEWSIGNAEELRQLLMEFLERGPDVLLDLSRVQACDTAVLQLLWACRRTADKRGQRLQITALSPAIEEIAAALGLAMPELIGGDSRGV